MMFQEYLGKESPTFFHPEPSFWVLQIKCLSKHPYFKKPHLPWKFLNTRLWLSCMARKELKANSKNSTEFADTNIIFDPKYEEFVVKSIKLKNKSKELVDVVKPQNMSTTKDSGKKQPFRRTSFSQARGNRRRGAFPAVSQSPYQPQTGWHPRGKIASSTTSFIIPKLLPRGEFPGHTH